MKKLFTYHFFLKSSIYILLIGQLWTNTVPHCHWVFDVESELVELLGSEDSESEKEEKKEKDKKLRMSFHALKIAASKHTLNIFHSKDLSSIYHPEINTPPPQRYFFYTEVI